jgi:hypothetical protein
MKKILAWLLLLYFVLFVFLPIGLGCHFFVDLISLTDGIKIFGLSLKYIWALIVCIIIGFNLLGSD